MSGFFISKKKEKRMKGKSNKPIEIEDSIGDSKLVGAKRTTLRPRAGGPMLLDTWDKNNININNKPTYVRAKATVYPNSVRIFISNMPYKKGGKRNSKGSNFRSSKLVDDQEFIYETNKERAVRRSRKAIKDYVLCNNFNLFGTLTFAKDRFDDDKCISRFKNWMKNQRDRNGKFPYIAVAERHKSGALHFHVLFSGYSGKLKGAVSPNTNKPLLGKNGTQLQNFVEYTHGHSVAEFILDDEGKTKTAYYLQKYIGKDLSASFGKNRYWASKGLKTPNTIDNPVNFFKGVKPAFSVNIDHGKILEYVKGQSPAVDSFIEANQK